MPDVTERDVADMACGRSPPLCQVLYWYRALAEQWPWPQHIEYVVRDAGAVHRMGLYRTR
jgi:hypothetical protein